MTTTFPRLVEKYGKQYSWKMILNPRCNINERIHARVGECNAKARESYFKGWKRSLGKRVKPQRQQPFSAAFSAMNLVAEPGASTNDPKYFSLRQKVANSLSKVRTPQLTEFIKVGNIIGSGVEGVVRPGFNKSIDPKLQASGPEVCLEQALLRNDKSFQKLAQKFNDGDKVLAIKTVEKLCSSYGCSTAKDYREVKVMQKMSETPHPNITSYVHTFESPIRLHIVTEYNEGGDLFGYLQDHDFERQTEHDAARVMMQLFTAALYSQEQGYVHLDLKLENVMRRKEGKHIDEGGICLIDFGHASKTPTSVYDLQRLHRPVGSPSYASPEVVLNRQYGLKTDAWSLGVIMYILIQGYLPFPHLQQKRWREFSINDYGSFDKNLVENDPFYYTGDWEDVSSEAKELCQGLLQVDYNARLSLEQALDHPWFKRQGFQMVRTEQGLPVMDSTEEQGALPQDSKVLSYL